MADCFEYVCSSETTPTPTTTTPLPPSREITYPIVTALLALLVVVLFAVVFRRFFLRSPVSPALSQLAMSEPHSEVTDATLQSIEAENEEPAGRSVGTEEREAAEAGFVDIEIGPAD